VIGASAAIAAFAASGGDGDGWHDDDQGADAHSDLLWSTRQAP